jgi:hypothetical protein
VLFRKVVDMGRASDQEEIKRERRATAHEDRVAVAMRQLDLMCMAEYSGEVVPTMIKLRLGVTDEVETLCVVEATGPDGGPLVGFNGAQTPTEALVGAINRVRNGQMKWRVDDGRSKKRS